MDIFGDAMREQSSFDHSSCPGRNLPPCTNDVSHGHSALNMGVLDKRTGKTVVVMLCKTCAEAALVSMEMGPAAVLLFGDIADMYKIVENGISPDDAELRLIEACEAHPEDEFIREHLAEYRSERAEGERKLGVYDVVPMPVNEVAALFARTTVSNPKDTEVIN